MKFICRFLGAALLCLSAYADTKPPPVEGYTALGRGSCQDVDGKMYTYLQRTMQFPNAETCGMQECARFGGKNYRGFEYSVTKRCTCLFDIEKAPPPPVSADPTKPEYVTKTNGGIGPIAGTSGTPGGDCYRFGENSGLMAGSMGSVTIIATATYLAL